MLNLAMSRGLGRIERAILAHIEEHRRADAAEDMANAIYGADDDATPATRAQRVAVIRAAHLLARKCPDRVAVAGGKGSQSLHIGSARAIEKWISDEKETCGYVNRGAILRREIAERDATISELMTALKEARALIRKQNNALLELLRQRGIAPNPRG
jgi:hypothetical protein